MGKNLFDRNGMEISKKYMLNEDNHDRDIISPINRSFGKKRPEF